MGEISGVEMANYVIVALEQRIYINIRTTLITHTQFVKRVKLIVIVAVSYRRHYR